MGKVRKNQSGLGFTVIDNSMLRDSSLTLKAKGLLALMWSLPDGWAFSAEGLAKLSKDGRDGTRVALQELEDCRYLIRHLKRDETGKVTDMDYTISLTPIPTKESVEVKRQEELRIPLFPVEDEEPTKPEVVVEKADGFSRFWQAYPRKVGKADCVKIWKRKGLEKIAGKIIDSVQYHKDNDSTWENTQYIPYPSTYLNQGRWEDELEEEKDLRERLYETLEDD